MRLNDLRPGPSRPAVTYRTGVTAERGSGAQRGGLASRLAEAMGASSMAFSGSSAHARLAPEQQRREMRVRVRVRVRARVCVCMCVSGERRPSTTPAMDGTRAAARERRAVVFDLRAGVLGPRRIPAPFRFWRHVLIWALPAGPAASRSRSRDHVLMRR